MYFEFGKIDQKTPCLDDIKMRWKLYKSVVVWGFPSQYTLTQSLPPLANDLDKPLTQCKTPVESNQHTTEHIHNLDHESQESVSAFFHGEKHRLDVVFEEDSWDRMIADDVRLLGDSVLVCEESFKSIGTAVHGVDRWDNWDEILEFVEVVWSCRDGAIEGVKEGGVEGSEREFRHDMGEIESYITQKLVNHPHTKISTKTYQYGPNDQLPIPDIHVLAQ